MPKTWYFFFKFVFFVVVLVRDNGRGCSRTPPVPNFVLQAGGNDFWVSGPKVVLVTHNWSEGNCRKLLDRMVVQTGPVAKRASCSGLCCQFSFPFGLQVRHYGSL